MAMSPARSAQFDQQQEQRTAYELLRKEEIRGRLAAAEQERIETRLAAVEAVQEAALEVVESKARPGRRGILTPHGVRLSAFDCWILGNVHHMHPEAMEAHLGKPALQAALA